jgi:hypothetical protein
MPRRKKRNLLPVLAGFVVILVVAIAAFIYFDFDFSGDAADRTINGQDTETIRLSDIGEVQDRLPAILELLKQDRRRLVLPATLQLPVADEDITADGFSETIAVELTGSGRLSRELTADGFQGPASVVHVYSVRNSGVTRLLAIDRDSMRDAAGRRLLDQERAVYGYAYRLPVFNGNPYNAPVRLIEVVMLDASGSPASDDLTIYWIPSQNRYAANNKFGAPGTFGD